MMNRIKEFAGLGIAVIALCAIWSILICFIVGGAVGLIRLAQFFWRLTA